MRFSFWGKRLLILALTVLLVAGCSDKAKPAATPTLAGEAALSSGVTQGGELTALGTIRPAQVLQLGFRFSGPLRAVHAQLGAHVQAGDLLAELDTATLELELQGAQEEVAICQAQLALLTKDPEDLRAGRAETEHAQQIAQAEIDLRVARWRLQAAQGAASAAEETARLDLLVAANALREVQDAYSHVYWENENRRQRGIELTEAQKGAETAAWRRVEDAEAVMRQAHLVYEQSLNETSVSLARAEVELAQLQLDGLLAWENPYLDPIPAEQIRQGESRLRQAELAVERLELQLRNAELYAPFDGVVAAVYLHAGEWVSAGEPVVEVIDTSRWHVETRNVSELSIGQIRLGQDVIVQVHAFRDSELSGHVAAISPIAVVQQGDTTYTLIIELEPTDLELWPGMNAQVTILLE